MKAHACPACGNQSFRVWQKMTLGPARTMTCRECGVRVSVPWIRYAAWMLVGTFLTFLGGVFSVAWIPVVMPMPLQFMLGMTVVSIFWLWVYDRVVPLVVR